MGLTLAVVSVYYSAMSFQDEAGQILSHAQKLLLDLERKAAEERDYAAATLLMKLADGVSGILAASASRDGGDLGYDPRSATESKPTPLPQDSGPLIPGEAKHRRPRRAEYPKFLREGDNLIKIAWSKKERAEYEHRASAKTLFMLIKTLAEAGANRRRFIMDDILPRIKSGEGGETPSYQAYLCLAWLKAVGLVTQHGRRGYSLSHPTRFESEAQEHWQRLVSGEQAHQEGEKNA